MKSRTVHVSVRIDDFERLTTERTTTTTLSFVYEPGRPTALQQRETGLNNMHSQLRRLLEATE